MLSRESLSRGLGVLECLAGFALLYQGCRYGWLSGDSTSNVTTLFIVASALFAFIVPGGLLFLKSPLRWLSQVPLALVLAWLGFNAATRALGMH
ncbi:MAG TPA: hypothetical protein VHB79_25490 [Polyangiaceae bacterium]|nr:hypothetical protein [Polyangiaceae bacterium]